MRVDERARGATFAVCDCVCTKSHWTSEDEAEVCDERNSFVLSCASLFSVPCLCVSILLLLVKCVVCTIIMFRAPCLWPSEAAGRGRSASRFGLHGGKLRHRTSSAAKSVWVVCVCHIGARDDRNQSDALMRTISNRAASGSFSCALPAPVRRLRFARQSSHDAADHRRRHETTSWAFSACASAAAPANLSFRLGANLKLARPVQRCRSVPAGLDWHRFRAICFACGPKWRICAVGSIRWASGRENVSCVWRSV